MIRIANLKIDSDAWEFLPESMAREECVLPLGARGGKLRVVFGRRPEYSEGIEKLEFVLNRRLICAVADRDRVERAIDEVYRYRATEIEDCPLEFRLECPRKWLELYPTARPDVRFCASCDRDIYLCKDENEAIEHARLGRCIAVFRAVETECLDVGMFYMPGLDDPPEAAP